MSLLKLTELQQNSARMFSPSHDSVNTGEMDAGYISPSRELTSQQTESEPFPALSDSSLATPDADEPQFPLKCVVCGVEFPTEGNDSRTSSEALRLHMSSAHSSFAVSTIYGQQMTSETPVSFAESETVTGLGPITKNSREHQEMTAEQRCLRLWNMHDVNRFTDDYDCEDGGLPDLWTSKFDGFQRPKPYEKTLVDRGEFLPLTNPDIIIDMLKNPESHHHDELYAMTANVTQILKVWQDEYMAIERLRQRATESTSRKKPKAHTFEDPVVFEDKKEAMLYGYKYDPAENRIGRQDPFLQGGFAPTTSQLAKLQAEAKARGTRNIDGWTPIIKDGEEYIPMIGPEPPIIKKKNPTNARGKETDLTERTTRFGGSKYPPTRETSLIPSAPPSPIGGRGRFAKPRAASGTPQKATFAQAVTSAPAFIAPPTMRSVTTANTPAASTSPGPSAEPSRGSTPYPDPLLDPKNQEKVRNSKNPKRTEAMILHWAKFNSEGRTRNPKRSKAQIEAAKVVEKDTVEKIKEKKRKVDGSREPGTSVFSIKRAKLENDSFGSPVGRSTEPEAFQQPLPPPSDVQRPAQ